MSVPAVLPRVFALLTVLVATSSLAVAAAPAAAATPVAPSIAAGGDGSCSLTSEGRVKCWGVGPGFDTTRITAFADPLARNRPYVRFADVFVQLAVSFNRVCGVTAVGGVRCAGNTYLGNGTANNQSSQIVTATGLTGGVTSIAVARGHSCAVISGAVRCWGKNDLGQLGTGPSDTADHLTPVGVVGLDSGVKAVAVGDNHSCALMLDGTVKCWGTAGQTGTGGTSTTIIRTPLSVPGVSGIVAIASGDTRTCALTVGGGVKCWLGGVSDVPGLSEGAVAIAAGRRTSCAVMQDGGVKCWGTNDSGQLGTGSTSPTFSATPVDVLPLGASAVGIAVGDSHVCAALSNATAECWGSDANNQLGDGMSGSPDPRPTPVTVLSPLTPLTQTLTFDPPASVTYGDAPVTLSASSSSNLAVDVSVASGPCTLSGQQLSFDAPGDCVVRADQAGDGDHAPATTTRTITIRKAAQTIDFAQPAPVTYGDAPVTLVAATSSKLQVSFSRVSGPCAVDGDQLSSTGAGDCVVRADQAGDATFDAADPVTRTVTIKKAAPTVMWADPAPIRQGTPLSATQLNATASVPGAFVYDPAAGTTLGVGAGQPLTVTFTPTSTDYAVVTTTVHITVIPNHPPVAEDTTVHALEDTALDITLRASDPDGDSLTYAVTGTPSHGTLACTASACRYVPARDYNGPDAVRFTATDPDGASSAGTVNVIVDPVNDAPTAKDLTVTLNQETTATIALDAADVDGDTLGYAITTAPGHGTLNCAGALCTYTPQADYHGTDTATYTITDPGGLKASGRIAITVSTVTRDTVLSVPAVVKASTTIFRSGLSITLPFQGTLTRKSNGAPVAGRKVTFVAGTTTQCSAVTNTQGVAVCNASITALLGTVLNLAYTGVFDGDDQYNASKGTGKLVS